MRASVRAGGQRQPASAQRGALSMLLSCQAVLVHVVCRSQIAVHVAGDISDSCGACTLCGGACSSGKAVGTLILSPEEYEYWRDRNFTVNVTVVRKMLAEGMRNTIAPLRAIDEAGTVEMTQ